MNGIKYIDILLPFKESFEKKSASAVSLTVYNSFKHSQFKKKIRIFGKKIKNPFLKNYISLNTNRILDLGNNISIAKSYLRLNKYSKSLIEIHNRPKIFHYLYKKTTNPLTIHFHNDPTKMEGSKSTSERKFIAENAASVYFVSNYIKKKFCLNLNKNYKNLHVIFNGVERKITKKPKKKKIILFVGRLVKDKGINIFLNCLNNILKSYPDWSINIIGTIKPGYNIENTSFLFKSRTDREGLKIINNINKLRDKYDNFKFLNFLTNQNVKNLMKKSSILVVPSIWDDPCPLTPIEGLSNGCVVVSTNRGGIPEIVGKNGIIINNINQKKLDKELYSLVSNKKKLNKFLNLSWLNYKLDIKKFVKIQDNLRQKIILSNYH